MNTNDWVCIDADEDDYVIERFEVRVKGKKPLVLNSPSFSKLVFVTQQYLNLSLNQAKELIRTTVLDSPEPFTVEEYSRLLAYLEQG
uniref:Uncharacterized protein n=1 Tax=Vibrio sp. 23023 TaxID=452803 RepID=A9M4P4_9VIBR|nr:hypothetical protein [Vibrio sp. 23023]ABX76983.1 Conserved hypothetical protein [Vibrio sp. 23023]